MPALPLLLTPPTLLPLAPPPLPLTSSEDEEEIQVDEVEPEKNAEEEEEEEEEEDTILVVDETLPDEETQKDLKEGTM